MTVAIYMIKFHFPLICLNIDRRPPYNGLDSQNENEYHWYQISDVFFYTKKASLVNRKVVRPKCVLQIVMVGSSVYIHLYIASNGYEPIRSLHLWVILYRIAFSQYQIGNIIPSFPKITTHKVEIQMLNIQKYTNLGIINRLWHLFEGYIGIYNSLWSGLYSFRAYLRLL